MKVVESPLAEAQVGWRSTSAKPPLGSAVAQFELIHLKAHEAIARYIAADLKRACLHTETHLTLQELNSPWDFEEGYGTLHDFARQYERRWREEQKQEAIRQQLEKEQKHAAAIVAAKKTRRSNLIKAAQDWRFCGSLLEFVEQCERHWKSQTQPLTSEQLEWLAWAKQAAGTASTFPADFPDPTKDGGFDPGSIPFGGPYRKSRDLED